MTNKRSFYDSIYEDMKGHIEVVPEIVDNRMLSVSIGGDSEGLQYLARIMQNLAKCDVEDAGLDRGEVLHIHLHRSEQLAKGSCEVVLFRNDQG